MDFFPAGTRPAKQGNPSWFTGQVWLDPIIVAPAPARHRSVLVTFEAAARTAWHSHPLGQTLYVVAGLGLIGTREMSPSFMHVGDTVWIPPGEEHWHGAGPDEMMKHIAIHEADSGFVTTWMEPVADEDYSARPD